MGYYLGVDVGSVNAKLALVDEDGRVVRLDTEKVTSSPRAAVNSLIARLDETLNLDFIKIMAAGVSGSGRAVIPKELGWTEYSSSLAIASGLLHHYPDVKTIIQIGGQSTLVIELEDGLKKPWKVASNPLCAAGTGRFLEQQAYRIGISMEDFASLALKCRGTPPRIAARCSVFAKTDLIHLQQKGVPVDAMLYALCESIARMVLSLKKGTFQEPVYFVGGVAGNLGVAKSLSDMISARNGRPVEVVIPKNYLHIECLGAALLSIGKTSRGIRLPQVDIKQRYFEMPGLKTVAVPDRKDSYKKEEPRLDQGAGYLGVDVGSTSTKAVILDESGKRVLAKNYLMTAGRPVQAVKQVFRNLLREGANNIKIVGVGVTGSGRYLVGGLIGADLIKNEITAQSRAAAEIDPEADIIEIGGQDSKLVIKRNGVVVDYHMNKACAAGTGSFIDELAEMLGVSVTNGEFADLAFAAPYTIELGTRCAAFMGQAVASAQQEGVPLEVITASLANSIAKNYLSKVVEHRKLGDKIILTGAVFHNKAVVSAFCHQLEGKKLMVAEHNEVSGAIGAALLARDAMSRTEPKKSRFKGFQEVVDGECKLTTFVCQGCYNNCTITRMEMIGEEPTFYGSRCDKYDAIASHARKETLFDKREQLLFREYKKGSGTGPTVGIPRALVIYDYAPLIIGFLNALDARIVLSTQTNSEIMEQAIQISYTDSCFPLKLLHGHAAILRDVDYILYPCAIRLGRKDGDANQKYSCPLVQASPFIIRSVLGLGERLLIPIIDFSRGDADVIKNLADVAVKMGFNRKKGQEAARVGIESQRRFEIDCAALGRELLEQLHQSTHDSELGVVLFARSYMSQDAGANLGIAEKLAQLGVVPIPLDFLPLGLVDAKDYSDRPYWFCENKYIAGAVITAQDPQLYGLWLTNFGCGPNSFIVHLVKDIMGSKPLGQLEIDEHAAEAGIVTRLEAFVDTIRGFACSAKKYEVPRREDVYRRAFPPVINTKKTFIIPRMTPHVELVRALLEGSGLRAVVLPEANERNLFYADKLTSGTECLPYRVTLGDFLRFCYEGGTPIRNVEAVMAGAYGPCRFGKYALEQTRVLKEVGFDLPIRTTVSNNAYRDTSISPGFARLAWKGCVAIDYLQRLLWRSRPYEKKSGAADELFDAYLGKIVNRVRNKQSFDDVLHKAVLDFKFLIDPELPRRPLVGINGEIYLRSNRFSNQDLVKECEKAGLEVVVSSISEWLKYIFYRHVEDAITDRKFLKAAISYIIKRVWEHDEHGVIKLFSELVADDDREPSTEDLLAQTSQWLSPRCGSEAVLSIGSGIEWLKNPRFAGVISVMPHGCMPGGVVAALSEKFSALYRKPWINLTYDGFPESTNLMKINNFAEVVRFSSREREK